MRNLILTLFLIFGSLTIFAQDYDCGDYVDVSEDRISGTKTVGAKDMLIVSKDGKVGFAILLMQGSSSDLIILSITAAGGSSNCIDDDAKMIVLFRDGTRLTLTNNGKFNCDGDFIQYFGGPFGKKKQLSQLQDKEIEAIRVDLRRGFLDQEFTDEDSKTFKRTLNCLIE